MLKIQVAGSVPPDAKPEVFTSEGQKIPVNVQNEAFQGTALLKDWITESRARTTIHGVPQEIRTRAVWAKNSKRRFRCYIDDHSFSASAIFARRTTGAFSIVSSWRSFGNCTAISV